jgi:hypothetical protein
MFKQLLVPDYIPPFLFAAKYNIILFSGKQSLKPIRSLIYVYILTFYVFLRRFDSKPTGDKAYLDDTCV